MRPNNFNIISAFKELQKLLLYEYSGHLYHIKTAWLMPFVYCLSIFKLNYYNINTIYGMQFCSYCTSVKNQFQRQSSKYTNTYGYNNAFHEKLRPRLIE